MHALHAGSDYFVIELGTELVIVNAEGEELDRVTVPVEQGGTYSVATLDDALVIVVRDQNELVASIEARSITS